MSKLIQLKTKKSKATKSKKDKTLADISDEDLINSLEPCIRDSILALPAVSTITLIERGTMNDSDKTSCNERTKDLIRLISVAIEGDSKCSEYNLEEVMSALIYLLMCSNLSRYQTDKAYKKVFNDIMKGVKEGMGYDEGCEDCGEEGYEGNAKPCHSDPAYR